MQRLFFALPLLTLAACAQRDAGDTESLEGTAWKSFVGKLQTAEGGSCAVTYIGTEQDIVKIIGGNPADKRNNHYVLTAHHCIAHLEDKIGNVTISWLAGGKSRATEVYAVGHQDQRSLDDVAVLRIDHPGQAKPFQSRLASSLNNGVTRLQGAALTNKLFVAADVGSHEPYTCRVVATAFPEAGFKMLCYRLAPSTASGLSGALLVDDRGNPVGVFLSTQDANNNSYYAHSLAHGSLKSAYWTLASSPDDVEEARDGLARRDLCKKSLAAHCLGTAVPTEEDVSLFFKTWTNKGLDCTAAWTKKNWSDSGPTIGEACGFVDDSPAGLNFHAWMILRKDDASLSVSPNGKQCSQGNDCSLGTEGNTPPQGDQPKKRRYAPR